MTRRSNVVRLRSRVKCANRVGQEGCPDTLETDGEWCPMAHGNRLVSSFQSLPPLRQVSTVQPIDHASVSDWSAYSLGCFTGQTMAVCTYVSPDHPALVAINYEDGTVKWTSPPEDLPGATSRSVAAILIARMGLNGSHPTPHVFAVNPAEFVAYNEMGIRLWKTAITGIQRRHPEGVGAPVSVSFTDDKELVTATDTGWIIKVSPVNGRIIDAYQMRIETTVGGRSHRGIVASFKSIIVVGNILYLTGEFEFAPASHLSRALAPVFLVRLDLRQPRGGDQSKIKLLTPCHDYQDPAPDRLAFGVNRAGGSPSAWVTSEGATIIFANAETLVGGQLTPIVVAIEDNNGLLTTRWWSVLRTPAGDAIHAAPALHAESRTLLVNTAHELYVFRNVHALSGRVPSPPPIPGARLLDAGMSRNVDRVGIGSPIALTYDDVTGEILAYTNLRVFPRLGWRSYGFLGAFALRGHKPCAPRALWSEPLAVTPTGHPAPGPGTFGQPALFRYLHQSGEATGLIVNTVRSGTYIFR